MNAETTLSKADAYSGVVVTVGRVTVVVKELFVVTTASNVEEETEEEFVVVAMSLGAFVADVSGDDEAVDESLSVALCSIAELALVGFALLDMAMGGATPIGMSWPLG